MFTPSTRRRAQPPAALPLSSLCLALAAGLCAAPVAQAQTAGDIPTLPPVVVSATGYPQPLSQALPSVSVITREQIEESGAQNLTTLLQQVAGVQVTSNGGPGQSGNVFVRGFGGPDVLVLLDGVPINAQDSTGVAYLNNFTTDQIERIEIIRGNVSAIYGSGAIGGVILITTRKGSQTPQASVSVTAGSHGTATVSSNASGTVGKTRLQAGISRYTTQGIPSINPAQSSLVSSTASDGYRNTTMSASLVQELAPHQSLGLRAFSSDGKYTYNNDTVGGRTRQQLQQVFSDNQITDQWTSHLSLSHQMTQNDNGGTYASTYRTRNLDLLWRNVYRLTSGWTLTGGGEHQSQHVDSSGTGGIPSISRDSTAVFAGVNGEIDGNELQVNLRHDQIGGYTSNKNTGFFGYGRDLGEGFKAIVSYATAFSAPPLGYLYYNSPYWAANPQLKPESAHTTEAGLQWSQGPTVIRGTLFETRATDLWGYGSTPSGQTQFQNIAKARTRGLELTARGAWRGWAYDANLTLQQPVDLTKPGDPTLQRRARSLANISLQHEFGAVLYGVAVHYTGPRPDKAYPPPTYQAVPVTLGSYTTVDLTASGAITPQWSWNARVENLFDKRYQTAFGYNQPGFGVFVGLRWTPKL